MESRIIDEFKVNDQYKMSFLEAINEDLNTPQALAVLWEMVKSDISDGEKLRTIIWMDSVLGFGIDEYYKEHARGIKNIPPEVRQLIEERNSARKARHYVMADQLRNKIQKLGYDIQDTEKGTEIKKL